MKLILLNKDGMPVKIGDKVVDFRGDSATLVGWAPPYNPFHSVYTGATVQVKEKPDEREQSFYPSVYDLKFNLILDTDPMATHPSAMPMKACWKA
jgi:hypothetical protein